MRDLMAGVGVDVGVEEVVEDSELVGAMLDWVLDGRELVDLIELDDLDAVAMDVSSYNSSLLPAPQSSPPLPGQMKLQSLRGARVDVTSRMFPQ